MPWMKVDDNLHAHRKPRKAGVPAMGLWVLAGSWACDMLSDGFVPDYIAQSLDPAFEEHAAALVRAGLWEAAEQDQDEGWRFIGWDEYQPTKADVERKREGARERMARVRGKRDSSSDPVRANSDDGSENVPLTPSRPDPTRTQEANASSSEAAVAPVRPEVEALCRELADRIEGNGAKRPTIGKTWHDAARLMIDRDGRTPDQISRMIDWCQSDGFWRANILSMPKLREKYDQMKLRAIEETRAPVSKTERELDAWYSAAPGALEITR